MLTIETKYHGPTNSRGSRVSASTTSRKPSSGKRERITVDYGQHLDSIRAHMAAAEALAKREGWAGVWMLVGETERGFLFTPHSRPDVTFTVEA